MPHEYRMPRAIRDKLHAVYEKQERGDRGEVAVLEAASELGYEVEDATETPSKTEPGSYSRDVKLVKREPGPWGEVVHAAWAHFNHPGRDYEDHRDEWYMYFL